MAEGKLEIILGYAAGVGKTFRMLEKGQRLLSEGHDTVIGYFEPHGRADTIAKTEGLETVPRRIISYRGRNFEEMDTEAILARNPEICLVDEFPHTNIPGSPRAKRWEDVLVLLGAGIDVITTMNIQHLESLNDQVRDISGVQVRETIPDWVLKRAAGIELVDLTPGALLNRLDRGVVYSPDKAKRAREGFFKEPALAALREMAMRQTAHEVDVRQTGSRHDPPVPEAEAGTERVLVHVTGSPAAAAVIRRGHRVADYLRAECFAVAVVPVAGPGSLPREERDTLEQHLDFARKLQIDTRVVEAEDAAAALASFAHTNGITQIFVAKPEPRRAIWPGARRNLVMRLIRAARDLQVTAVAGRR